MKWFWYDKQGKKDRENKGTAHQGKKCGERNKIWNTFHGPTHHQTTFETNYALSPNNAIKKDNKND